jgi:peroxiredoxin (alkyl hydroperoxide reductase subunit C)
MSSIVDNREVKMKRLMVALWLGGAITGLAAQGALAGLPDGAKAPEFTAKATLGGAEFQFVLADALKHGPVVLYFYPAAFTKGCTVEAHEFAQAIDDFKALHATVIGISHDGIEKLDKFSVSECQSKFPVAADPDGEVIKAYDAKLMMMPGLSTRISYVIAPNDKIIYSYDSLDPSKHVENTLGAIRAWESSHKS